MSLSILNVGDGDTKITFDKSKPEERERAARIVNEMLRNGYAILVEVDNGPGMETLYRRVTAFDAETCEYIVAGVPGADGAVSVAAQAEGIDAPTEPKRRGRKPGKRVAADKARATSVARSAGGCHRNTKYVRGSR